MIFHNDIVQYKVYYICNISVFILNIPYIHFEYSYTHFEYTLKCEVRTCFMNCYCYFFYFWNLKEIKMIW